MVLAVDGCPEGRFSYREYRQLLLLVYIYISISIFLTWNIDMTIHLHTSVQTIAPAIPTCSGCFKPVNLATAVKRPILVTSSRYSRYQQASRIPGFMHFCNIECRQRADNTAHAENSKSRF